MNCLHCLTLPEHRRICDAYPQGWPTCGGRITVSGMAKNTDQYNPERERQQQRAEYLANLRRLGYRI
jgi:hypothetical protein